MGTDRAQLAAWLSGLSNSTLPAGERYHAIHELGRAEYAAAVPVIERFLSDDDPELRYVALEVLTRHYGLQQHWETARRFLEADPDVDCRMMGASALATLMRGSADRRTLGVLAQAVHNSAESDAVRQSAYRALLRVLNGDSPEQVRLAARKINLERDVDWKLVDTYLPG